MIPRVVSMGRFKAGLNNQRLALAGLVVLAQESGSRVALPAELLDFTPLPEAQRTKPHPMRPLADVLDTTRLKQFLDEVGLLSEAKPTELLDVEQCFRASGRAMRSSPSLRESERSLGLRFLDQCRAAEPLRAKAHEALAWLSASGRPLGLQLRVERDWQEYVLRRFGQLPFVSPEEDLSTDVGHILGKIAATPALASFKRILVCCDEDDLLLSQTAVETIGRSCGFEAIFKSRLGGRIDLPESRLMRSAIDFEICLGLDSYVGLSRSTFSNLLCLMKSLEMYPEHPRHYIYNSPGPTVVPRTDFGLQVEPARVVA